MDEVVREVVWAGEYKMEIREEIGEILLSDDSVPLLFWSRLRGWQLIRPGTFLLDGERIAAEGVRGLAQIVLEEDRELYCAFADRLEEILGGGEDASDKTGSRLEMDVHLQTADGIPGYYKLECHLETDEAGAVRKLFVRILELEAEEVYRIQLARVITNDKNPTFFTQGAKTLMEKHPDRKYALVQFDVAKFKVINEQYGEAVGDELLGYFVHTLKMLCTGEQLYVRLTADVFMILTPYEKVEDLTEFVEYLRGKLCGYKGIPYRLVFGICRIRNRDDNLRKYGDGAAFARQSIKEDALTHVAFFNDDMRAHARTDKFLEDNMEKALANREFVMYLQPKYSISKEKMIGAEALVRWNHPTRGMIPPMEFVPLFEKNGFVVKMDRYIWEEACKAIRGWMDAGMEPLPISVNVSRRHLKDGAFVEILNELVKKYDISREYLEIEITETVEEADVGVGIELLKDSGYTLLMDDFGSGYSSLNMLKDTQFDVIKIDRAFLRDFIGSERGRKIVEHTIRMTRAIGLELIAEGVETKEQAQFLSSCGCDMAQGFYYAKPMSLEEFDRKYTQ